MNLIDIGIENGLIRFDADRKFITYIDQKKGITTTQKRRFRLKLS